MALPSRKAKTAPASELRISGISAMTRPPDWSRRLFDPVLLDVLVQAAQRTEDLAIEVVVGTQLDAVGLGDRQGHLQNVDRIQPHAFAVQRGARVDFRGPHLQVERGDDQLGELELFGGERLVSQGLFHRGLVHVPHFIPSSDRYYSSSITSGRRAVRRIRSSWKIRRRSRSPRR